MIEKYAALFYRTIYIPGDERSRTNPGHGYPESTQETIDLIEFSSKEEMESWVLRRGSYDKYKLIKYQELSVKTKVEVSIE